MSINEVHSYPGGAEAPQAVPPPVHSYQGAVALGPRLKSPALACILSAMPGLGQVYVGYYQRGFVNAIVVASLITLLASGLGKLTPLAGVFLAFFWFYNVIDAGRRAAFYNQALAGQSAMALPSDLELPAMGGSLPAGVALVAVGVIMLANTLFDVPLEWLEDWWPVAPILLGVYLVWKSMQEKAARQSAGAAD